MIRAMSFVRCLLDGIGIIIYPTKTLALFPKRQVPTAEHISLLASAYVRTVEEERVAVVGTPVGTAENVGKSAVGAVLDGGVDCLANCLASMPDNKSAASLPLNPSVRVSAISSSS